MKIAFLVNEVVTEVDEYTTTRLARAAARCGHEVSYVGVGDAELGDDGQLLALGRAAAFKEGDTLETIAEEKLGSRDKWKMIARANGIDHPESLRVGQRLVIPSEGSADRRGQL